MSATSFPPAGADATIRKVQQRYWTEEESKVLDEIVAALPTSAAVTSGVWTDVSSQMKQRGYDRGAEQCRRRWVYLTKAIKTRRPWTKDEVDRLVAAMALERGAQVSWKRVSDATGHNPYDCRIKYRTDVFTRGRPGARAYAQHVEAHERAVQEQNQPVAARPAAAEEEQGDDDNEDDDSGGMGDRSNTDDDDDDDDCLVALPPSPPPPPAPPAPAPPSPPKLIEPPIPIPVPMPMHMPTVVAVQPREQEAPPVPAAAQLPTGPPRAQSPASLPIGHILNVMRDAVVMRQRLAAYEDVLRRMTLNEQSVYEVVRTQTAIIARQQEMISLLMSQHRQQEQ